MRAGYGGGGGRGLFVGAAKTSDRDTATTETGNRSAPTQPQLDRMRREDDPLTDCLPLIVRGVGVREWIAGRIGFIAIC